MWWKNFPSAEENDGYVLSDVFTNRIDTELWSLLSTVWTCVFSWLKCITI